MVPSTVPAPPSRPRISIRWRGVFSTSRKALSPRDSWWGREQASSVKKKAWGPQARPPAAWPLPHPPPAGGPLSQGKPWARGAPGGVADSPPPPVPGGTPLRGETLGMQTIGRVECDGGVVMVGCCMFGILTYRCIPMFVLVVGGRWRSAVGLIAVNASL